MGTPLAGWSEKAQELTAKGAGKPRKVSGKPRSSNNASGAAAGNGENAGGGASSSTTPLDAAPAAEEATLDVPASTSRSRSKGSSSNNDKPESSGSTKVKEEEENTEPADAPAEADDAPVEAPSEEPTAPAELAAEAEAAPEEKEEAEEDEEKKPARRQTRRKKDRPSMAEPEVEEAMQVDQDDDGDVSEGVTRCVCGQDNDELSANLMIECDTCKCWQHGPCVGLWNEKDCPDRYFCELCKPGWHGPGGLLRKAYRKASSSSKANGANTATIGKGKARESTDSITAASTKAQHQRAPSITHSETAAANNNDDGSSSSKGRRLSAGPAAANAAPPKKRSTMNSRDAAYDEAIALSFLGPGTGAIRAKLERERSESRGHDDEYVFFYAPFV